MMNEIKELNKWRDTHIPHSWIGELSIVRMLVLIKIFFKILKKMSVLNKLIYRFNAIPSNFI